MENASKALIIAGAILIAIVLVTVSVVVVNSFDSDEAVSQMDQQEISSFNSKFESASGSNVRGSVVKTLLSNVITSNASNEEAKQICVTCTKNSSLASDSFKSLTYSTKTYNEATGAYDANEISKISNVINTQHTFKVTLKYNQKSAKGLVQVIELYDNG